LKATSRKLALRLGERGDAIDELARVVAAGHRSTGSMAVVAT
jgi:hypothetical protein